MGYVKNQKISIYNPVGKDRRPVTKDLDEKKTDEKDLFKAISGLDDTTFEYCEYIGQINEIDMYCYIALSGDFHNIDSTYIQIICKSYFQWLSNYLLYSIREIEPLRALTDSDIEREKGLFFRGCADSFYEYMWKIYRIDLKVITNISGEYYESSACCSRIVFLLSGAVSDERAGGGIVFQKPIEIRAENVRAIRKRLQMGREEMCLWAEWDWEKRIWKVRGLCEQRKMKQSYITFHMIQHMVWQMDIDQRIAVRYQCDKDLVESEYLNLLTIKKKFRNIFKKESSSAMEEVFQGAIRQEHGTILVVFDEPQGAEGEVARLLEKSTGIGILPVMLPSVFIQSASSIDGAIVVDTEGTCYGIGMILDGNNVKGNSTYGARHNSALKYVEQCKKCNLRGMVIVVSEDKAIRIHSTEK
mgnify:CR=1 FL=1